MSLLWEAMQVFFLLAVIGVCIIYLMPDTDPIPTTEQAVQRNTPNGERRLEAMREALKGKRLSRVRHIIGPVSEHRILAAFTQYDCGSCIRKSMTLVEKIRQSNPQQKILLVSIYRDSSSLNINEDSKLTVHYDPDGQLLQELNYPQTPFFLHIDTSNSIQEVHFPTLFDDEPYESRFLRQVSFIDQ